MRELEMQLPPSAASVPRARSALRTTFGTGESAAGGLVELLTCELVSNVVRHVGQPMTVRAVFGHSVRVEVDDPSTDVPVLAVPAASPDGGYGLRLIDALSSDWGVRMGEVGKTTWFELQLPGPPARTAPCGGALR